MVISYNGLFRTITGRLYIAMDLQDLSPKPQPAAEVPQLYTPLSLKLLGAAAMPMTAGMADRPWVYLRVNGKTLRDTKYPKP